MNVELRAPSDPRWLPHALAHFDEVLVDHAHCEKKAAANALSMLQAYPKIPGLALTMARLAREESAHLAKVLRAMDARGLTLGRDGGDPYAQGLRELTAKDSSLDRLLVAAVIEARSCERLGLLASGLEDAPLKRLYRELAESEHGHQQLFSRFAVQEHGAQAQRRLAWLVEKEAALVKRLPIRAAIH